MSYGQRLGAAIEARGRLCVGIDPQPESLQRWGLEVSVSGAERFAMTMLEAAAPQVAVIKPQSAFFEAFGSSGISLLARVIQQSQAAGALVLLDAKRGDIGSTMTAYARAYLSDTAELAADAITVSPFLGFGSLTPMIDAAVESSRGVYVLVRTSNPDGGEIQLAHNGERSIAQQLVDQIAALNPRPELGSVGIVYGLTHRSLDVDLSQLNASILVPGLGAQGGTPDDVARLFGPATALTLPSASRSIAHAGPSPQDIRRAIDTLRSALA